MRFIVLFCVSMMCGLIAACVQAPIGGGATPPSVTPAPVEPPRVEPLPAPMPAVISPGICTRDLTPCGGASRCQCPDGYDYDQRVKACLIRDVFQASEPGDKPGPGACAARPTGMCTMDINPAGNSSTCQCPEGSSYNQVVGMCLKDL